MYFGYEVSGLPAGPRTPYHALSTFDFRSFPGSVRPCLFFRKPTYPLVGKTVELCYMVI